MRRSRRRTGTTRSCSTMRGITRCCGCGSRTSPRKWPARPHPGLPPEKAGAKWRRKSRMSERRDMELIAELVPPGSRVLDLGCGNGELLAMLRDTRRCTGYGVEIADENVLACTRRGVE